MQRLEVSGAVRPIYGSLGVKGISTVAFAMMILFFRRLRKTAKSNDKLHVCMSASPSVRMEQLGSHLTDSTEN